MTLVNVRHPVPVRHVPRGARKERLSFAAATTPVRLREISLGETEIVGGMPSSHAAASPQAHLFAFGGRLWTTITGHGAGRGMPQEDVVAYLEGRHAMPGYSKTNMMRAFAMTPVLAAEGGNLHRGEDLDLRESRRILHDGTERAKADLVRFMEEEVLLVGGNVLVRVAGPMLQPTGSEGPAGIVRRYGPVLFGRYELFALGLGEFAAPLRLEEHRAFQFRNGLLWPGYGDHVVRNMPDLDPALLDHDDDLTIHANHAPRHLLFALAGMLAATPRSGDDVLPSLQREAAELQPFADLGCLGAIRPGEHEEVFVRVRDLARRCLRDHPPFRGYKEGTLVKAVAFIDEMALPRLRGPALAEDDAEALDGLAPGMGVRP